MFFFTVYGAPAADPWATLLLPYRSSQIFTFIGRVNEAMSIDEQRKTESKFEFEFELESESE